MHAAAKPWAYLAMLAVLTFGSGAVAAEPGCVIRAKIQESQAFFTSIVEADARYGPRKTKRMLDHGAALAQGLFLGDRPPPGANQVLAQAQADLFAARDAGLKADLQATAIAAADTFGRLGAFYSDIDCSSDAKPPAPQKSPEAAVATNNLKAGSKSQTNRLSINGMLGNLENLDVVDPLSGVLYIIALVAAVAGGIYIRLRRRRRHTRYRCYFPTEVIHDGDPVSGHVLDFSRSGVKIRTERAVAAEETVDIVIDAKQRPALIRWKRGQTIGVEFVETLNNAGLSNMKRFASQGAGFYTDEAD